MYNSFSSTKAALRNLVDMFCQSLNTTPEELIKKHNLPLNTLEKTFNPGHLYGHFGLFEILVNTYGLNPLRLFNASAPMSQYAQNNRDVNQAQNSHNQYANCSGCTVIQANVELTRQNNSLHHQLRDAERQSYRMQLVHVAKRKAS